MEERNENASLFAKVFGDLFLILSLFAGFVFVAISVLLAQKDPSTFAYYFSLPLSIVLGALFLLVAGTLILNVIFDKKRFLPYSFLLSSIFSLGVLLLLYFTILGKMKIGTDESFFSTVKFTFSFFLLILAAVVSLSSVMPVLTIIKGMFNSFLHAVAYIAEASLWVILFILTVSRIGAPIATLLAALLFLRSGIYWWVLIYRKEYKKN